MSVVSLETKPVPAALAGMVEHFTATAAYMPGFVYQLMKDPEGNFRYTDHKIKETRFEISSGYVKRCSG